MDLQSREWNFSGCLVESWVSGFMINLKIKLTDIEGEALMELMGVNEMERIHGGDSLVTGLLLDPTFGLRILRDFLGCKII